jgi:hypothetical protein
MFMLNKMDMSVTLLSLPFRAMGVSLINVETIFNSAWELEGSLALGVGDTAVQLRVIGESCHLLLCSQPKQVYVTRRLHS